MRPGRPVAHNRFDVGHVDVAGVRYELPDGRVLLDDVSFRVGEGAKVALVGANGAGKTTLLRIITGELAPHAGVVTRSGGLGRDAPDGRHRPGRRADRRRPAAQRLARPGSAPPRTRCDRCERALMETDDEKTQMAYAEALAEYADAGGYDVEVVWDVCTVAGLGVPYERAKYRELRTLSGGEQKRLVLEFLLRGPDEVLLLDEPDNFLDVPGKIWLEQRIRESEKTILYISHDRELLNNTATRVVTVELGGGPAPATARGPTRAASRRTTRRARTGSCASRSCAAAGTRSTPRSRRWCCGSRSRPSTTTGWPSQYKAAQTRLRKFEEAGPPTEQPREQQVRCGSRAAGPASARSSAPTSSSPG